MNKVILIGNLAREIELRYAPSGSAIATTSIAVTEKFKKQDGSMGENVLFIDLTFFGRSAEVANQYLQKGHKLAVEGKLKLDQWTDNNGQKRSKHSITVESMEMLTQRDKSENKEPSVSVNRNPAPQYKTQDNNIPDIDIYEEQIPF